MTHYDPTQRAACKYAAQDDLFTTRDHHALWLVTCKHCRQKKSFKALAKVYEIVERNGVRVARYRNGQG